MNFKLVLCLVALCLGLAVAKNLNQDVAVEDQETLAILMKTSSDDMDDSTDVKELITALNSGRQLGYPYYLPFPYYPPYETPYFPTPVVTAAEPDDDIANDDAEVDEENVDIAWANPHGRPIQVAPHRPHTRPPYYPGKPFPIFGIPPFYYPGYPNFPYPPHYPHPYPKPPTHPGNPSHPHPGHPSHPHPGHPSHPHPGHPHPGHPHPEHPHPGHPHPRPPTHPHPDPPKHDSLKYCKKVFPLGYFCAFRND